MLLSFGVEQGTTIGYNLFADKWLNLSVVESSVRLYLSRALFRVAHCRVGI
jgi:hypothetical protein